MRQTLKHIRYLAVRMLLMC